MPSLRMRACNVVRFMPRRTAAPFGPPMRHCVCFKARRMCWRSASWRVKIDEVLEFADVAGPGVAGKSVHDVSGDVLDIFVELTAESLHEVANQEREIFGALAERRDLYGENVQAVVEIA